MTTTPLLTTCAVFLAFLGVLCAKAGLTGHAVLDFVGVAIVLAWMGVLAWLGRRDAR